MLDGFGHLVDKLIPGDSPVQKEPGPHHFEHF